MRRWSTKETEFLIKYYPDQGPEFCAALTDRTTKAVITKASKMGLKYLKQNKYKVLSPKKYEQTLLTSEYTVLEDYKGSQEKILHKHSCGYEWKVSPNNLKKLVGCPGCSTTGAKEGKTSVYLCEFPVLGLYKVGLTRNWNKRKYNFGYAPELILLLDFDTLQEAQILESQWLRNLTPYLYNSGELKSGNTETFLWQN